MNEKFLALLDAACLVGYVVVWGLGLAFVGCFGVLGYMIYAGFVSAF